MVSYGFKVIFRFIITLVILITITSCSNGGGNENTKGGVAQEKATPKISSFIAINTVITLGQKTSITPIFSNGDGEIDNGIGAVFSGNPIIIQPDTTTTYTLTVVNSVGESISQQLTISVAAPPNIISFTSSSSVITQGGSVNIIPVFSEGSGSIDHGLGTVTSGIAIHVNPSSTTTYTLTVSNLAGETITQLLEIIVSPPLLITSFTASLATVTQGGNVSLTSVFTGGSGSIDHGVGTVTTGIPVIVSPSSTTTYTLTIENSSGDHITQQLTVSVVPPPHISSFTANKTKVKKGENVIITPIFSGDTGSVDNGIGAVVSGGAISASPTTTTSYSLTATNSDGVSVSKNILIIVYPLPERSNPTQVSVANRHSCALDDAGVVCWGWNNDGQISVPVLNNPRQVVVGDDHSCALDDSGVSCWGSSFYRQTSVPPLTNPRMISAGRNHTCALDDTGAVCWGNYRYSIILTNPKLVSAGGDNTCTLDDSGVLCFGSRSVITNVPALSNPTYVDVGDNHACAIDDTGVVCWGVELMIGDIDAIGVNKPPVVSNPKQVSVGQDYACVLDDTGVVCWRGNPFGAAKVPQLNNPIQLSTSYYETCAIDDSGIVCWGNMSNESYGQTSSIPLLTNPSMVSPSLFHTCVLDKPGVVCWGRKDFMEIPSLINPRQIDSGIENVCALDDLGVACWGKYKFQLNNSLLMNPSQISVDNNRICILDDAGIGCWNIISWEKLSVPIMSNPKQVSVGYEHICALNDSGVECWGDNTYGQTTVPVLSNPRMVSAGTNHTCAVDDTGFICWGDDTYSQLFTRFVRNTQLKLVSAGDKYTCLIRDNSNRVYCSGNDPLGRAIIPPLINPRSVSAGVYHTCALDDTGVVCWGLNDTAPGYVTFNPE